MGAKLYGARWNSPGSPVVYTFSCGALAALEYTAHVAGMIPRRFKLLWIDVPDTLGREEIAGVPSTPAQFRQYCDEWLARQKEPVVDCSVGTCTCAAQYLDQPAASSCSRDPDTNGSTLRFGLSPSLTVALTYSTRPEI